MYCFLIAKLSSIHSFVRSFMHSFFYPSILPRLRHGTTLFERLPPKIDESAGPSGKIKPACTCVKREGRRVNSCDIKPLPEIDEGGETVNPIVVPPKKKKPGKGDSNDYDDDSINYDFKPKDVDGKVHKYIRKIMRMLAIDQIARYI